jgi:hypothetical protein
MHTSRQFPLAYHRKELSVLFEVPSRQLLSLLENSLVSKLHVRRLYASRRYRTTYFDTPHRKLLAERKTLSSVKHQNAIANGIGLLLKRTIGEAASIHERTEYAWFISTKASYDVNTILPYLEEFDQSVDRADQLLPIAQSFQIRTKFLATRTSCFRLILSFDETVWHSPFSTFSKNYNLGFEVNIDMPSIDQRVTDEACESLETCRRWVEKEFAFVPKVHTKAESFLNSFSKQEVKTRK